ncbi:sugar phosphate isomerase/epimerase family protein [Compostimonas suwonensis]|uniref:Sugar phosphate isomerase/epimerase n=1 Tax=Compostimonas suwonensis TaxID=1048394 RepID=A0A2M9C4X2_9MICO|nr:sugar phosphate isomerase/epimerase family protein [Compostimonas suwonensis]PJJ65575.1 sugar phosphate isomerase/epimerase [Compostimonas suwonensis]
MALSATTWPICAALLQYPAVSRIDGVRAQDAPAETWLRVFEEVAAAGFDDVELADSWVSIADLSPSRLEEFGAAARAAGLGTPTANIVRRSVIDAEHGTQNLDHAHRMLEAAAALGARTVCASLHQPLTAEQRERLWFWTGQGHVDPDDAGTRQLAVARFRELGQHAAELGLQLSLELYEDTYLGSSESAVRLVTDIGLPNVGLNPDIGNLIRLHRPIEDWWDIASTTLPYANYWHVKNYSRDEQREAGTVTAVPAYLEAGLVNYREAVALAVSVGFQGVICCEHYGGDGLSVSAANQAYLRRILPQRGDYTPGRSLVAQLA